MDKPAPPKPTEQERFVVENWIVGVEVSYEQTGNDTAETFVIIKCHDKTKSKWTRYNFDKVADLQMDYNKVAKAKPGIREKVEAWDAYEKEHQTELAEYRRLKEKFGDV